MQRPYKFSMACISVSWIPFEELLHRLGERLFSNGKNSPHSYPPPQERSLEQRKQHPPERNKKDDEECCMEKEDAGEEELFSHEEEPSHNRSYPDNGCENNPCFLAEKSECHTNQVKLQSGSNQDEENNSPQEKDIHVVGEIGQRACGIKELDAGQEIDSVEAEEICEKQGARHRHRVRRNAGDPEEEF